MSINLGIEELTKTIVDEYTDDKSMSDCIIDLLQSQIDYQIICQELSEAIRSYENLTAIQSCINKYGSTEVLVDLIGFTPSVEGLGDMASGAIRGIVRAIETFLKWIGDFIKRLFGIGKKTENITENLKNVKQKKDDDDLEFVPATADDLTDKDAKLYINNGYGAITVSKNYERIAAEIRSFPYPKTEVEMIDLARKYDFTVGNTNAIAIGTSLAKKFLDSLSEKYSQETKVSLSDISNISAAFNKIFFETMRRMTQYSQEMKQLKLKLSKVKSTVEQSILQSKISVSMFNSGIGSHLSITAGIEQHNEFIKELIASKALFVLK